MKELKNFDDLNEAKHVCLDLFSIFNRTYLSQPRKTDVVLMNELIENILDMAEWVRSVNKAQPDKD